MNTLQQAYETQIRNIQSKTGKTFDELKAIVHHSGLTKHGELRDMLKQELGLGHGDANALVHAVLESDGERAAQAAGLSTDEVLDAIYTGPKAGMRPIHERVMAAIHTLGGFEIAPKKGYVSLRRKKQFAMLGPVTSTRFEVGLNMKGVDATERLVAIPAGGMCNYKVKVADPAEVDSELIGWIKRAYDGAG